MDKEFWLERWARNEIGFHQGDINPHLRRFWHEAAPASGRVFVPLCGKSRDLLWLRDQGCPVLGVELSAIAAQAFFEENGLTPVRQSKPPFESFEARGVEILCGDFFNLDAAHLKDVTAVYDRAALVALPPELRARYAAHLADILPSGAQLLLVTFDYDQKEMGGPPFSVPVAEVEALFAGRAAIRQLARIDALADNPRFRERGASRIEEHVFLLTF
ncbi:MAG: thiopurine S-methyltransferase [Betaproteobacteria bacterium]|nr:thiopurine S-methyltransferase [Betaproteobacteria bacterium]MDE2622539.1 thiopurine S-methyltransferase [Betaproteobacteria bacterium]